jgi:hypothetical protein
VTVWDLFALLRRQWIVCVVGTLLTVLFGAYVASLPGVYSTQVQLDLIAPSRPDNNALISSSYQLIGAAGAVADVVGAPTTGAVAVPGLANLTGVGVRDGYSVRLPNTGGQWSVGYDGPFIDIQAVGPTEQKVLDYVDRARLNINSTLATWETAQGVRPRDMIRTQMAPEVPSVSYDRGSQPRALATVIALGIGLTVTMAGVLSRVSRRLDAGSGIIRHAG